MATLFFSLRTVMLSAMFAGTVTAAAASAAPEQGSSVLSAAIPADTRLVVADQRQMLQVAFAASGELKQLPFEVKFADFRGGPAILEAFRGGALDLALVGDTPPIQAHVSGYPLPIVAARMSTAVSYHFALTPGSKVASLEDFRGKKIAYAEGTAVQSFVLNTLKKAGLSKHDVTLVPLRIVDFTDAVRSGEVDVAPMNEPPFSRYLTAFKKDGAHALDGPFYDELPRQLTYLYASKKALEDPTKAAAIARFVQGWVKSEDWVRDNTDAWIQAYYVKSQNLPTDVGETIHQSLGGRSFPSLSSLIPLQQGLIDLIHAAGEIPARLDAHEEFDLRFDTIASDAAAGTR